MRRRVHRSEDFISTDAIPIVRIAVGYSKQEATNVQWSGAASGMGVSPDIQRRLGAMLAAAYADHAIAVEWH